ncbi:hypothetical protein [Sediminibacterium sp.]|uniref:hypothetical protein n=1 Tax=Sediminibacterium sp. TaxID=1917865 RepID=UPI0027357685|nr:hypothetical protein [Sediminibacterium sp.]MDP3394271.1 hypothetical protein [Sediminibacterium sp.]MDP3568106.1 hypothetical protein [Sediminibacterium sp.]
MKKFKIILLSALCLLLVTQYLFAQPIKNDLLLSLAYFNNNNQTQYLKATAKSKVNGKFQQVANVSIAFYIDDASSKVLLGKATTDHSGNAIMQIKSVASEIWKSSATQNFSVSTQEDKLYNASEANLAIVKAKISLDTLEDKSIVATLLELKDSNWLPIKEVDIRVAVKRMLGELNVAETATYTSDSLGMVTAEFTRDSLPGDSKGNLILIAKLDEHELYGNLTAEMIVPWGIKPLVHSTFNDRSLFARKGLTPIWLELLAYSIILIVWSIIIYLIFQIKKIIKLGV